MGNCGSSDSSTSGDLAICEPAADPPDPSSGNQEQTTLNDVDICMDDSLNFQDSQKLTCDLISSRVKDGTFSLVKENNSADWCGTYIGNASSKKSVDKCVTYSCSSKICAGVGNVDKENESLLPDRSASFPSTLKLVPAMKGSREKLRSSPRVLSVTWAPDVYDPIPKAVSHVPTNKSHRHRSDGKKNGRNKQKGGGKSSRGSTRSKDKKQARKVIAGSSRRSYKALVDDFSDAPLESLASRPDFEVGSVDVFCGSSFLKKISETVTFPSRRGYLRHSEPSHRCCCK